MAWIPGADREGNPGWWDSDTGEFSPNPPPAAPTPVLPPTQPGPAIATLEDIYNLYRTYLGRDPNYATEAFPRVGLPLLRMEAQIRCGQEAAQYRASHGAEPDSWCFNRDPTSGEIVPGAPGPIAGPPPPPPTTQPPGSSIPGIGDIIKAIWGPIQEILDKVGAIKTSVGERIGETLRPIIEDISKAGARITQTLADNITQLIPAALNLAAEAADKAASVAQAFTEQAASVGDVAGGFIDAIKNEAMPLEEWLGAVGSGIVSLGLNGALHVLEGEGGPVIDAFANRLLSVDGLPEEYRALLGQAKERSAPFPLIPIIFGLAYGLIGIGQAVIQPAVNDTLQGAYHHQPNMLLGLSEYANAVARQLRDYSAMEGEARIAGISPERFRLAADLAFQFPPAQTVVGAELRGLIEDDESEELLNRLGYDARSRGLLRAMALQLPSVQDTIRMAVREAFDPVQRKSLTLDADYPAALTPLAHAIGLSEEWARNYWAAHWELPGVNSVFDMLHRDLVKRDDVAAYLKAADFAPVWRDKLIELSYDVFTRVDIRRIHDMLKKDHVWLVAQHKRLGYNADDAETLSQFVELLNDDERQTRRKELTGSLAARITSNVVSGTLSDEQATTFYTKLGYSAENIANFLSEAALVRNERRTERVGNLIGDLYVKGRRTLLEATTQLRERGFTDQEMDYLFREWDLEKELRAPTEREEKDRDLTRADIEAMYRARQLERPLAKGMLVKLRYSTDEADAILALQDFKVKQDEDKDRVEVVHRKFVKGTLDRVAAAQQLGTIGVRATSIEASIARWELEISAKSADLSVSQVGEVYKLKHWDDNKTRSYLTRLGYDADEISALLRTWGSKIEEANRRDALAAQRAEEARQREAKRVLEAAARKEKDLAKTDLLNAGAAGVLGWVDVRAALIAKGYSIGEADTLIRTKQQQGVKRVT